VEKSFPRMADGFLHCWLGGLSFIYLGLPFRASPRSMSTWELFSVVSLLGFTLGVIGLLVLAGEWP
jgi:hypothetical protein